MLNNPLDTQALEAAKAQCTAAFQLRLEDFRLQVNSNSPALIDALRHYYRSYPQPSETHTRPQVQIWMLDQPAIKPDLDWRDWPRETGKSGLKEAVVDLPHGQRLIRKVKTGMLMLQRQQDPVLIGPAQEHLAQAVNFINNQHINHLQQQGGLICHAAALSVGGRGVAVAASSGGGKSTLMLRLMELPEARFITNDRLFVSPTATGLTGTGVAKLPRVNPGTLLHNPRLRPILSPARQAEFGALTPEALWELEFKSDVPVEDYYGPGSLVLSAPLHDLILLNWSPASDEPCQIQPVNLEARSDLLPGIMKSPGAFYQNAAGEFLSAPTLPPEADYRERLSRLNVYEASGRADFDHLVHWYAREGLTHG
ncbi:HprK-related kinase B [Marinobacterium sp. AK62]|uniref:HprK-related kinase B n=1 Tax=Marinobacterium alkalitolerans TaxID=1542925 RepID=A0ABS3Z6B8_9GAMM|nr:HprK-related kinase B [Marinobacterium alkalitolerans]MBP0047257.1 HprK-related kinase B [Marinobacterium alkalitolerans]